MWTAASENLDMTGRVEELKHIIMKYWTGS
jgi:hypothetical protein